MLRRRSQSEVSLLTKYILFFSNFIFTLAGLALLVVGSYVLYEKHKNVRDAIDFFFDPSCVMCLTGAVTFVVAVFGSMGALRENTCLLKTYHYVLSILFLGEIVLTVIIFIFYFVPQAKEQLHLFPKDTFEAAIKKYRDDDDMRDLIDSLQKSLHCCGLSDTDEGYKDWKANIYFNCSKASQSQERCSVPYSCCVITPGKIMNHMCGHGALKGTDDNDPLLADPLVLGNSTANIYRKGCLKALGDWINSHALVIAGGLLGVLLPQLFLICLSANLVHQIKAQKAKWLKPTKE